jgi:hypothetical protein
MHLKHWAGDDGKIAVWRLDSSSGRLSFRRGHPASVAYQVGLYALRGLPFEKSQQIENAFFANQIEARADKALGKLITRGVESLTSDERRWWAVYVQAFMFRLPHKLEMIGERVRSDVLPELSKVQDEYELLRGNAKETTILQWIKENLPETIDNLDLEAMVDLSTKDTITNRILELTWIVMELRNCDDLLLADCPLLQSGALGQSSALLVIPLSPTRLFLAFGDRRAVAQFVSAGSEDIVRSTNVSSLSKSREFAFGNASRAFVEENFGK